MDLDSEQLAIRKCKDGPKFSLEEELADFPAVFFKLCHGTQQAVATAIRG